MDFHPSSPTAEHLEVLLKTKSCLSAVLESTEEDLTGLSFLPSLKGVGSYLFILLQHLIFEGNKNLRTFSHSSR